MSLTDLWRTYLEYNESAPKVFTHFTFALFFAVVSVFFLVSIVISKIVKGLRQLRTQKLEKRFDHLISEVILSEEATKSGALSERQLFLTNAYKKKYLRSKFAQDLMINRMLDLKRSIEGTLEQSILELYRTLDLHKNSIRKVKSRKWFVVVKGMKEISEMQVKEANYLLIEKLSSRNQHIIREAQIALVKLSPQNPLYFLDQPGIFLTQWQKLRLHKFIRKYAKEGVPAFEKWLDSGNTSVIIFALRMIAMFQQLNAAEKVASFLDHPEVAVRKLAAQTLEDLGAFHLADSLLQAITTKKECVSPTFLRALAELSTPDISSKIARQLVVSPSYNLKKEAVRTLLKADMTPENILDISEAERPELEKIIHHLQDPLLS